MKKTLFGISLTLGTGSSSLFAQDKESDRVENAGKGHAGDLLNAPDSIPQSVLDKAGLRRNPAFRLEVRHWFRRQLRPRRDDLSGWQKLPHGHWGAPTMMALEGGSAGLQLGRYGNRLRSSPYESTFGYQHLSAARSSSVATSPLCRFRRPHRVRGKPGCQHAR